MTDQPPPAAPDIVDRLRAGQGLTEDGRRDAWVHAVMQDAADEIARLRAALRECADDLERKVWALFPVGRLGIRLPPDQERYNDHMAPVRRARELLK